MTSKIPITSSLNDSDTFGMLPARKVGVFTIHINRNILLTLILSILLHLSLLWLFAPKLFSIGAPQKDARPLEITLGPAQKKETAPSEEVLPDLRPLPQPLPQKPTKPPKTKPTKEVKTQKPPIKTVEKSDKKITKQEPLKKERPKAIPQPTSPQPLPGEDMQAYVSRVQRAKLAKKGLSEYDIEEVLASSNPQSDGDRRDAKIKKNLDLDGTNGIFSIRSMNVHTAKFSFKGWKHNVNTARLEIIDVRAPDGVDIKKAVIRKMIVIIRREYSGDFKWDSRRLHRVVTLSARQEDTKALEDFMMLEFFGAGAPYAGQF